MASLNVVSLNCPGFNSGTAAYLRTISSHVDIILLQETWLSDINCNKIGELLPDFVPFHTSAMEDKLSSGFRSGRPFGATAMLIRQAFSSFYHRIATGSTRLSAVCCQPKKALAL